MKTKSKKLEQIDEIVGTSPKTQTKKKRKTKFVIIIASLLLLCCVIVLGAAGFAWYGGHIQKSLCDNTQIDSALWEDLECEQKYNSPEEPTDKDETDDDVSEEKEIITEDDNEPADDIEVISIELTGKTIQIEISQLLNQDTFIKDLEGENVIQMYNNPNLYGSTGQYLTYFYNERAMTNYYANNDRKLPFESIEYPLETTVMGTSTTIHYLSKYLADDTDFQGGGSFYWWEPTIQVHGHQGSAIVNYANVDPVQDNDYDPMSSRVINTVCIFKLYDISKEEYGYVGFDGYASAGSEINYCELLNELDVFEISIIKN